MEVGFRSLRTGRVGFKNILLSVWIRFSHFSSELGRVFQWLKKKKSSASSLLLFPLFGERNRADAEKSVEASSIFLVITLRVMITNYRLKADVILDFFCKRCPSLDMLGEKHS